MTYSEMLEHLLAMGVVAPAEKYRAQQVYPQCKFCLYHILDKIVCASGVNRGDFSNGASVPCAYINRADGILPSGNHLTFTN